MCCFPRGTRHHRAGGHDDLERRVVDFQPHSQGCLTFEAQNTVADVVETAIIDHGSHMLTYWSRDISKKRGSRGGGGTGCWAKGLATTGEECQESFLRRKETGMVDREGEQQ